jgi:hypothetical protein
MGFSDEANDRSGFDLLSRVCGSEYMLQTNHAGREHGSIFGFRLSSTISHVHGFTSVP